MAAAAKATAKRAPKSTAAQSDTTPVEEQIVTSEDADAVNPPELVAESVPVEPEAPKTFGPPEGMYPEDAELFSYTPKGGAEPIWFPMKFEQPDAVRAWELYDKPFHVQSWEWMKWAKIPRLMQRRAVELLRDSPDEYLDLFNKWMQAAGGVQLGE